MRRRKAPFPPARPCGVLAPGLWRPLDVVCSQRASGSRKKRFSSVCVPMPVTTTATAPGASHRQGRP
eukprot:9189177-Lingulodinium_polyedra.AAC.1